MNYELLKQLKEVGFPQDKCRDVLYLHENGNPAQSSRQHVPKAAKVLCTDPSTDELIEELGDSLGRIYRRDSKRWVVTEPPRFIVSDGKGGEVVETMEGQSGESLKECLIKLYIQIHKDDPRRV